MFRVLDIFEKVIRLIVSLIMVITTLVIFYQILQRNITGNPTIWSEELVRYGFIWLVLLTSAIAIRRSRHIRIDFIITMFSPRWKLVAEMFSLTLILIFLVVLFQEGWTVMEQTTNQRTPGLGITKSYAYAAIPIGTLLMMLYTIEVMINTIRNHLKEKTESQ